MLSNIKKTLIKSTSSSKHNFEGSNHNLQHQEPNEQSASNASSSVAPSSELSRSSYVPSDDDSESSLLAENSLIFQYVIFGIKK